MYSMEDIDVTNLPQANASQQHKSLIQLQTMKNMSSTDELTYRVHPLGKNKIFVRIENLADRFDENEA